MLAGDIIRPPGPLYKSVVGVFSGRLDEGLRQIEKVLPLGAGLTVVGELSQVPSYGMQMKGAVSVNGMAFVIGPCR